MSELLRVERVSRRFGRVRALEDVSTRVEEGEIRGLIGPNGAGKTTLINVLTGFLAPSGGRVFLAGRRIDRAPAHARVRAGLARTFQTPQLFPALDVRDNVAVGAHQRLLCARFRNLRAPGRASLGELRREAEEVAARLGLQHVLAEPASALPYGHARLVEIARALIGKPRLLLLDEPVAGMNEAESEQVAAILRRLRDEGTTILLIEHDMPFVMSLCDRLTVLNHGRLLAEGTPAEVRGDPEVQTAYLGSRREVA